MTSQQIYGVTHVTLTAAEALAEYGVDADFSRPDGLAEPNGRPIAVVYSQHPVSGKWERENVAYHAMQLNGLMVWRTPTFHGQFGDQSHLYIIG